VYVFEYRSSTLGSLHRSSKFLNLRDHRKASFAKIWWDLFSSAIFHTIVLYRDAGERAPQAGEKVAPRTVVLNTSPHLFLSLVGNCDGAFCRWIFVGGDKKVFCTRIARDLVVINQTCVIVARGENSSGFS